MFLLAHSFLIHTSVSHVILCVHTIHTWREQVKKKHNLIYSYISCLVANGNKIFSYGLISFFLRDIHGFPALSLFLFILFYFLSQQNHDFFHIFFEKEEKIWKRKKIKLRRCESTNEHFHEYKMLYYVKLFSLRKGRKIIFITVT